MTHNLTFGDALSLLTDDRRRSILLDLFAGEPETEYTIDGMTDHNVAPDERDRLHNTLVHAHLPKLDDADIIDWDRDSGTIRRGDHFEEIEPLLDLIDRHRSELPDGWVSVATGERDDSTQKRRGHS